MSSTKRTVTHFSFAWKSLRTHVDLQYHPSRSRDRRRDHQQNIFFIILRWGDVVEKKLFLDVSDGSLEFFGSRTVLVTSVSMCSN